MKTYLSIWTALLLCCPAWAQGIPGEYGVAERLARETLRQLGVNTDRVQVIYDRSSLASNENGNQNDQVIRINLARYPESVKSVFHEFWHYYQQERVGGYNRFTQLYNRYDYNSNPFEREAQLAADVMEHVQRTSDSLLFRLLGKTFPSEVGPAFERIRPRMEKLWQKSGLPPEHLREFKPVLDRAGSVIDREVGGMAQFAAAYVLKEGLKAVETGDVSQMKAAVAQMATGRFWGDVGVFTVVARVAEHGVARTGSWALTRSALPLAAGMAAVQLLHGQVSLPGVVIDTASFLVTGWAVNLLGERLLYTLLFRGGLPGWGYTLYSIGKLTLTLYGGEKLANGLRSLWGPRRFVQRLEARERGVAEKVASIQ